MMESGIRSNIGLHSLEYREKSLQLFSPQRPLLLSVTHLRPLRYSDCDITSKNSGSINMSKIGFDAIVANRRMAARYILPWAHKQMAGE